MTTASLKEQLQALGLSNANAIDAHLKKKRKLPHKEGGTQTSPKPAWLEYAQYGVELLKAHFPLVFKETKEIQPLKIGIKQDLVKALSAREDIVIGDKACMVSALAYYVNSVAYHKSVLEGSMRIDLQGRESGTVTPEEAQYSLECRKAKLNKKHPVKENLAK